MIQFDFVSDLSAPRPSQRQFNFDFLFCNRNLLQAKLESTLEAPNGTNIASESSH